MSYVIKNDSDEYWSNESGWVDKLDSATVFSQAAKDDCTLPLQGVWTRYKTQQVLNVGARLQLKKNILNITSDLMANFLYYDRKESDLKVNAIEDAIIDNVITIDEIVAVIQNNLEESVDTRKAERIG